MPIPSEDLFGSELYQSTIARYYLEHKELVSSFYNLDDPEMRERFLLSLLESQGATVPYMYAQLCQIMEKDDGVKQVDYSPERFRFQILRLLRRPRRNDRRSAKEFSCSLATIWNVKVILPLNYRSNLNRTIRSIYYAAGILTARILIAE